MTRGATGGREKIQIEVEGSNYTGFYDVGRVLTVYGSLGRRSGHVHGTDSRELRRAARLILHEMVDAGEVEANTHARDDDALL